MEGLMAKCMPQDGGTAGTNTSVTESKALLEEYVVLQHNKSKMSKRKVNQMTQTLLDKCIVFVSRHSINTGQIEPLPSQQIITKPTNTTDWQPLLDALGDFRQTLLTAKEQISEEVVQHIVHYINEKLSDHLSADERHNELQKQCLEFLQDVSPQLSIKVAPLVKSYISRQFGLGIDNLLAEVCLPDLSVKDKTLLYQRMFNTFLDNTKCISFACSNRQLLGQLSPADVWFLTFFSFVTARRSRADNLLMLGLVGKSSTGKSMLFESIVLTTGHQLLSSSSTMSGDVGVGRFNTESKNIIILHDINIATLIGVDMEKIKSLARSETTVVKVHSSTTTVSPMFLFYTSNERLFRHVVSAQNSFNGLPLRFYSQADEQAGRKRVSEENLDAIRARFLEMFVHKCPPQNPSDLEQAGSFERIHFVLGMFDKALCLLEHYDVKDFHSLYLPAYVLSGLCKNLQEMETIMCNNQCVTQHQTRLDQLKHKFQLFL